MPLIQNLRVSLHHRRECFICGCGKWGIVYFYMPGIEKEMGQEYWECLFHFGVWSYIGALCIDLIHWVKKLIA